MYITTMKSFEQRPWRKAGHLSALIIACLSSSSYTYAFQSSLIVQQRATTTRLYATGGKGFGSSNNNSNNKKKKKQKYTIEDKSYGSSSVSYNEIIINPQTPEEFFSTYKEWLPLFQAYQNPTQSHPALTSTTPQQQQYDDTLWGISTLENRNPWRLNPAKPESSETGPLGHIGTFLDEWQRSLLDIPIDTLTKEEEIGRGNNDLHFLEEGRRVIAVTRFQVLDVDDENFSSSSHDDVEEELFRTCWSEMGKLMSEDVEDTGSLVVLPNYPSSLEYVQQFVQTKLLEPVSWLGRSEDWEIVAMERGSLAVRLLYKLSAIPDLSEKYSPEEDE